MTPTKNTDEHLCPSVDICGKKAKRMTPTKNTDEHQRTLTGKTAPTSVVKKTKFSDLPKSVLLLTDNNPEKTNFEVSPDCFPFLVKFRSFGFRWWEWG